MLRVRTKGAGAPLHSATVTHSRLAPCFLSYSFTFIITITLHHIRYAFISPIIHQLVHIISKSCNFIIQPLPSCGEQEPRYNVHGSHSTSICIYNPHPESHKILLNEHYYQAFPIHRNTSISTMIQQCLFPHNLLDFDV